MNAGASQSSTGAEPPPVPLPASARRWRRLTLGGLALAALLLGGWVLWAAEPRGQIFYPRCQFHSMTGLLCPGCGSTRALHHLLHGDLGSALRSNALLLLGLFPLLAFAGWKTLRGQPVLHRFTGRWAYGALAVLLMFFVARNLPGPTRQWLNPPPPPVSSP